MSHEIKIKGEAGLGGKISVFVAQVALIKADLKSAKNEGGAVFAPVANEVVRIALTEGVAVYDRVIQIKSNNLAIHTVKSLSRVFFSPLVSLCDAIVEMDQQKREVYAMTALALVKREGNQISDLKGAMRALLAKTPSAPVKATLEYVARMKGVSLSPPPPPPPPPMSNKEAMAEAIASNNWTLLRVLIAREEGESGERPRVPVNVNF